MSDVDELEKTMKDVLIKQSIETLECFKKGYVEVRISQCKGAKFGKRKGEYEAYKSVGRKIEDLIALLKGENNE